MTIALSLPHALVTDPLVGGSSGYSLVGASPGVYADEAQILESTPLITDHLHIDPEPRQHFAFFRLGNGRWVLSRRFVQGRRRGEFHRLVVHSLILSRQDLEQLAWQPTLLLSHARYRLGSDSNLQLNAVGGAMLNASGDWQELPLELTEDPWAASRATVERRRQYLIELQGAAETEQQLREVFAWLQHGKRVLLPPGASPEQLLALAWSTLPWQDRSQTAWTTHLAASASGYFHLANIPQPERVTQRMESPGKWRVHGTDAAPSSPAAGQLANLVIEGGQMLHGFEDLARRDRVSLLGDDSDRIVAVVTWLRQGGASVLGGFGDLDALAQYLEHQVTSPSPDAPIWERAANQLAIIVSTVMRLLPAGQTAVSQAAAWLALRTKTLERLGELPQLAAIFDPQAISRFAADIPAASELPRLAIAVGLASDFSAQDGKPAVAEDLWRVLAPRVELGAVEPSAVEPGAVEPAASESPLVREVLIELVLAMARQGAGETEDALRHLAQQGPGAVSMVLAQVRAGDSAEYSWLPLLDEVLVDQIATQEGWQGQRVALVRQHLLPLLHQEPALVDAAEVPRLADWITFSSATDLADMLCGELALWRSAARRSLDHAHPERLQAVAAHLSQHELLPRLGDNEDIEGLSYLLITAGVDLRIWLPVAVLEARRWDTISGGEEFRAALESIEAPMEQLVDAAPVVLNALGEAITDDFAGPAHSALLQAVSPVLISQREQLVKVLAQLVIMPVQRFVLWGAVVDHHAQRLRSADCPAEASRLCRDWWESFSTKASDRVWKDDWSHDVSPRVSMLSDLEKADGKAVAQRWIARFTELPDSPSAEKTVQAIGNLTTPGSRLEIDYLEANVRRAHRLRRIDLVDAVALWQQGIALPAGPRLLKFVDRLLQDDKESPSAERLMALATSKQLSPGFKILLETLRLNDEMLSKVDLAAVDSLPLSGASMRLQLRWAQQLGKRSRANPQAAGRSLRQSIRQGRFDLVARLLTHTDSVSPFESHLDQQCLRDLENASTHPAHGWELAPAAAVIRSLGRLAP